MNRELQRNEVIQRKLVRGKLFTKRYIEVFFYGAYQLSFAKSKLAF